ncbi:MAG: TolC family protein [Bacteroidota bacterium]
MKNTIRGLLIIGLFSLSFSQMLTAQAPLSLKAAIETSLANNTSVKRGVLAVEDAEQAIRLAYAEVFPEVTSSINYTRNFEIPVSFFPAEIIDPVNGVPGTFVPVAFGTDNNWQGGFSVSQTLLRGEAFIGISSSAIFKAVQEENLRLVSQQIVTQTRLAYYAVLVAQEQFRLQEAQVNRLQKNLDENQVRADAGLVDDYDVLRLQVQLSNQKPQLIEAEYAVQEAYRNLKTVMGIPVGVPISAQGNLNEFDITESATSVVENQGLKEIDKMNIFSAYSADFDSSLYFDARGDLRLLDASIKLKDREISAIRSRFLPTLNAIYNLQWTSVEPGTPNFFEDAVRFQTLGLNLELPLFTGFERLSNVQRAKIEYKDLEQQKRQAELTAENEIASYSEDIEQAYETSEARKLALKQAREGYERAKKRFDNGLGSQLEVTEAEVQVREAEVNYALMVFNYLSAKANYDYATGMVPFVDLSTN